MGLMQKMMGLIPGMSEVTKMMGEVDEGDMKQVFGIIDSMTPEERRDPTKVVDPSRRRRIAEGSGTQPNQVNDLVKQFDGMASMMKQLAGKYRNICVVGDVDQSIYRFRGASTQNIIEFPNRVGKPGLAPINLDINYRSSQQIIELYQSYLKETNWGKS